MSLESVATNTKLADVYKAAKFLTSDSVCRSSDDWVKEMLEKNPDITMDEAVADFLSGDNRKMAWAVWCIKSLPLSEKVRLELFKKIDHPTLAFHLYTSVPDLTDAEEKFLLSLFEGKLPTAEQELADGSIVRAKDVV